MCRSVVRQYSPEIYASAPTWRDGLQDLVQDVIANALIRDAQVEYIVDISLTMDDVRRLLRRQIRHVLARGRRRTVVDQLLDRSVRLMNGPPFEKLPGSREPAWSLAADSEPRTSFREAVAVVRSAARIPQHGLDRAPAIFTTETLQAVLESILELHSPLTRRELGGILEFGLTPFLPDVLNRNSRSASERPYLEPEDELQVAQSVASVVDALSPEQLALLRSKLLGWSDSDVAAALGVSRPTAAARKREMLNAVASGLSDVRPDLRDIVMDRLSVQLALPHFDLQTASPSEIDSVASGADQAEDTHDGG
ncbi:MAG TPA: hypothetical protein DCR14_18575 [Acidimicrobiaceae bacterium]|nr:hypothetical protein [Acidimicrobiaceae bacterium]